MLNLRALLPGCTVACVLACGGCITPGTHAAIAPELPASTDGSTRMVQVRGAWLRVHTQGSSESVQTAVVFVHGYGSRLEAWRLVQPAIAQTRSTLSFDQRGFGKSERPAVSADGGYGALEHARDLWALLDAEGVTDVVLVGHSYGAGVVMRAAVEHPERVRGVVLVSPFVLESQKNSFLRWAEVPGIGEWLYATSYRDFAGEKMLLAFAEPERFATLQALDEIEENHKIPGSTWAALATVRGMDFTDAAARYASLGRPIVVVWGEKDRVTPIRTAPEVTAALGSPTLVRVPNSGHMPPWENPDAVTRAIEDLLTQLEAPAAPTAPVAP